MIELLRRTKKRLKRVSEKIKRGRPRLLFDTNNIPFATITKVKKGLKFKQVLPFREVTFNINLNPRYKS